jgi:hypothetical protein
VVLIENILGNRKSDRRSAALVLADAATLTVTLRITPYFPDGSTVLAEVQNPAMIQPSPFDI